VQYCRWSAPSRPRVSRHRRCHSISCGHVRGCGKRQRRSVCRARCFHESSCFVGIAPQRAPRLLSCAPSSVSWKQFLYSKDSPVSGYCPLHLLQPRPCVMAAIHKVCSLCTCRLRSFCQIQMWYIFKIHTFLRFYRKLTVVLTHSSTLPQKAGLELHDIGICN
jgi:hypothetical protein